MKRKGKQTNRPPDDVLRWGPFQIERYGRTAYARNLMTPEEFSEHLEHLAQQVPIVAAEIDRRVTRIAEIVRTSRPDELLLRAWWMFAVQHIGVDTEVELGSDHVLAMRMIDYIQSVIAAVVPAAEQAKPSEECWQELKRSVDELFALVNGPYMAARTARRKLTEPNYDEQQEELYFKAQVYWTTVRGDRYPHHLIEQLRDFLTPQDVILRDVFGVSAAEIVTAVEKIEWSLTLGASKAAEDFRAFHRDSVQAMEEEFADSGRKFRDAKELGDYTFAKRGWIERRDDVMDRAFQFGLFDLQKITDLPESLLRELSWAPGEETKFFDEADMKGWPLRVWPIHLRPFLFVNGRHYCFDIYAVRDHLYRVISRAVFRLRPDLKQRWEDQQREASEAVAVSLLSSLVGGATTYAPAYYQWPATKSPAKNWCECDGLVVTAVDRHLFVVEVKAGSFTYTAPTNDFPAYIASAMNLIEKPLSQGRRFLEYLNSAAEMAISDREHNEVVRLRREQFEVVTICGVTLDALTELAAQAEHLKPLGVNVGSTPVWGVSIDDLRVMRDLFSNPLFFLHYLRQRRRAVAATSAIKVDDELDHLGLYFIHNDYLQAAQRISGTEPTMWRGFKEPIDRYYNELLTDPGNATVPGQKLPEILQMIVNALARQQKDGRSAVAAALLDLAAEPRRQLAMQLESALSQQKQGAPPNPASVYGPVAVTIFCWQDGVISSNATYAREMTLGLAALAGEESRLLIELTFDPERSLRDVSFELLRPDTIDTHDHGRVRELARAIYQMRAAAEGKIGRNAPCPCGSGKKYKKCHLVGEGI